MYETYNINFEALDLTRAKVKRGSFTTAYIFNNLVVLQSNCIIKDCLSHFSNSDKNKYCPDITAIGNNWYIMPRYKALTKKHKKAYEQFQLLCELKNKYDKFLYSQCSQKTQYNYDVYQKIIAELQTKDEKLANALNYILNIAANGSQYLHFDLQQVNFSVDNDGNLILRDIFADWSGLSEPIKKKKYKTITEALNDDKS